jgi:DNA-binding transcriptional MocR family regulator
MSRTPYLGLHVPPTEGTRRVTAADIVASVQREIGAGALPAGSRLPPVRALERQLGLSKNTAQAAYDELVARGLVEARPREGVFVLAPHALAATAQIGAPPLLDVVAPPLSRMDAPRPGALSLSTVFVDPELLPAERLAECARAVLRDRMPTFYDVQGFPPLRAAIAKRLRARGLDVESDEVIVTTGSQQSLDIVARAMSARSIALESPVYSYAKLLFETLGHQLVGLPLDPFRGLDLAAWDRALAARPGLAYLISSFQNPTGYSYTSAELRGVLALCEKHGVAILEDDWGSDMLSDGEHRPGLRMLGGKNVLYVNSFTKKLLPSLRIGFVVAPQQLVPTLVGMKRLSTLGNPWLTEAIVAEFLDRGYYDTHLAALQRALDERYVACLAALDELMPDGVTWTRPGGGPTLWLELPARVDLPALEAHLARRGVTISNGSVAFVGGAGMLHGFRVAYAFLSVEQMRVALTIVADALRAGP